MIKVILGIQHVNHTFIDGLDYYHIAVEIGLLIHVINNPIHKCAKEITFAKLDNAFRALCFGSSFFV